MKPCRFGPLMWVNARQPSGTDGLSSRELEIAALVAEGRSNKQVGAALHLSEKTIENNLSRIYAKLGVRSRVELATAVATRRDDGRPGP